MLLDGFRLIDLTQGPPGATCTHLLADMGMDVIRVQAPRGLAPTEAAGQGSAFDGLHRNKRSMTLNLREQGARDVFFKLASTADALIESFRPSVTARLGIDYPALSQTSPRLVYCSISGYGQTGPYAQYAAHDSEVSAGRGPWARIRRYSGPPLGSC